jgi:hypothetical protein
MLGPCTCQLSSGGAWPAFSANYKNDPLQLLDSIVRSRQEGDHMLNGANACPTTYDLRASKPSVLRPRPMTDVKNLSYFAISSVTNRVVSKVYPTLRTPANISSFASPPRRNVAHPTLCRPPPATPSIDAVHFLSASLSSNPCVTNRLISLAYPPHSDPLSLFSNFCITGSLERRTVTFLTLPALESREL